MRTEDYILDEHIKLMDEILKIQTKQKRLFRELDVLLVEIDKRLDGLAELQNDPDKYFEQKDNG